MLPAWLQIEIAFIPVLLALVGLIIWLVRLEGAVKINKIILDRHIEEDATIDMKLDGILSKISEVSDRVARIEGEIHTLHK